MTTLNTRDVDNYAETPVAARPATQADLDGNPKVLIVSPTRGLLYIMLNDLIAHIKGELDADIRIAPSYEIAIGERNEIAFQYNTRGKDFSGFAVTWYDNLRDADDRNDPVSGDDLPTNVSFNPTTPVTTEAYRTGFLNFTAPASGSLSPVISLVP